MGTGCPTSGMGVGCLQALMKSYRMGKALVQRGLSIGLGASRSLDIIGIYGHLGGCLLLGARSSSALHSIMRCTCFSIFQHLYFYLQARLLVSGMESGFISTNDRVRAARILPTHSYPSHSHTVCCYHPRSKAHHTNDCCNLTLSTRSNVSLMTKSGSSL